MRSSEIPTGCGSLPHPFNTPDTPCFHGEGCENPCQAWRVCWGGYARWSDLRHYCGEVKE